jgi:ABC-type iron transport system FetAB ATPase subunit
MNKERQQKYEAEMIKLIKAKKYMQYGHIDYAALSFGRATAYEYDLEKLDTIKNALAENRSKAVDYMLQKWIAGDNATLQIAAMKIVADDNIRVKLIQQQIDTTITDKRKTVDELFPPEEELNDAETEDQ